MFTKKIFKICLFFLLVPRFFVCNSCFKLGLESISDKSLKDFGQMSIGLITNQTGVDCRGQRNVDLLLKKGLKVKKMFTPEHGISGMVHTDDSISNSVYKNTKVKIITLYSQGRTIKIDYSMIKDLDALIFDIQDSGMRHYTYITTMFEAMQVAAKYNRKFIVLDRPNLLGPCMDGPLVERRFKSAISIAPIPIRHGMTVGELALYFNKYVLSKPVKLFIVKMKDYKRDSCVNNKLLTFLSSGIRNLSSCYCYTFLGVLGEIRPFNIGLGTKCRFQCIMLNEKIKIGMQRWKSLQNMLRLFEIESSFFRMPIKKVLYNGLSLRVKDINNLKSFNLLISIIAFFEKSGLKIRFSKMFDLAVGTDKIRDFFEGKIEGKLLENLINSDLKKFYSRAQNCFLYSPFPRINYLDLSGIKNI